MTTPVSMSNLLQSARQGNPEAVKQVWIHVYDELRRIAQRAASQEYGHHSIQATEIAHEAFWRLAANESLEFESRAHLLATLAQAIRRLLIDRGRARAAEKRGGKFQRVLLDDVLDSRSEDLPDLIDLEEALTELESIEPRHAKLVELRFYGGITLEEAAKTLQISLRTAAGDWAFARAWLRRRLEGTR
jgi:RNA polymerase sigma factor (TIGR02999 family)